MNAKEAAAVYAALGEAGKHPALSPSPSVTAFYRALVRRWPELDDDADAPWAARLDRSRAHVLLPISFSRVADVVTDIRALASEHGLHVFDPQRRQVQAPGARLVITPKPKGRPAPRATAEGALGEQLAKALAKSGFTLASTTPFVTAELQRGGAVVVLARRSGEVVHELRFVPWAGKRLHLHVRILHDTLGATIAQAVGSKKPVPLVDTSVENLWRDASGSLRGPASKRPREEYRLGTAKDAARTASAIAKDVQKHLVPRLARLSTVKQLSAFFDDDPESALPTYTSDADAPVWAWVGAALARSTGRKDGHRAAWVARLSEWGAPRSRAAWTAKLERVVDAL